MIIPFVQDFEGNSKKASLVDLNVGTMEREGERELTT